MPETRLAIGRERGTYLGRTREWLYWYNETGERLPTPEERAERAEQELQQLKNRLQAPIASNGDSTGGRGLIV